jgi:hypothetical protein
MNVLNLIRDSSTLETNMTYYSINSASFLLQGIIFATKPRAIDKKTVPKPFGFGTVLNFYI